MDVSSGWLGSGGPLGKEGLWGSGLRVPDVWERGTSWRRAGLRVVLTIARRLQHRAAAGTRQPRQRRPHGSSVSGRFYYFGTGKRAACNKLGRGRGVPGALSLHRCCSSAPPPSPPPPLPGCVCVFVKFAHSLPSGVPGEGGRSGLGGACIPFPLQGPSLPQVDGGGVGGLSWTGRVGVGGRGDPDSKEASVSCCWLHSLCLFGDR